MSAASTWGSSLRRDTHTTDLNESRSKFLRESTSKFYSENATSLGLFVANILINSFPSSLPFSIVLSLLIATALGHKLDLKSQEWLLLS